MKPDETTVQYVTALMTSTTLLQSTIIWDCGATDSITNDPTLITDMRPSRVRISGVGPTAIHTKGVGHSRLGIMYYAPELKMTLISQGSLRDQRIPFTYETEQDAFIVHEREGTDAQQHTFQRRTDKGLYELEPETDLRPHAGDDDHDKANSQQHQEYSELIIAQIADLYADDALPYYDPQNHGHEEWIELVMDDIDGDQQQDTDEHITALPATRITKECMQVALQIHHNLGHPNNKDLIDMIDTEIIGCFYNKEEIAAALNKVGPCLACLQGKAVINNPFVPREKCNIPGKVLCVDMVHTTHHRTKSTMHLLAICEATDFIEIEIAKNNTRECIDSIHRLYKTAWKARGYELTTVRYDADKVVSAMTNDVVLIEQSLPDQHQRTIERTIRTLRERIRCITSTIHFHPDEKMLSYMMKQVVDTLNCMKSRSTGKIPNKMVNPEWKLDLSVDLTLAYGDLILCNVIRPKTSDAKITTTKHACIVMHTSMDGTGIIRVYSLNSQQYYATTGKQGAYKKIEWTDNIRNVVNMIIHDGVEQPLRDVDDFFVQTTKDQFLTGEFHQTLDAVLLRQKGIELMDKYQKAKIIRDGDEFNLALDMQQNEALEDLANQIRAHRDRKKQADIATALDTTSATINNQTTPLAEGESSTAPPSDTTTAIINKITPLAGGESDTSGKIANKRTTFKIPDNPTPPSDDKTATTNKPTPLAGGESVGTGKSKRASQTTKPPDKTMPYISRLGRIQTPKTIKSFNAELQDIHQSSDAEPSEELIEAMHMLLGTDEDTAVAIKESKLKEIMNILSHDTISPVHFNGLTEIEKSRRLLGRNDTKIKRDGRVKSRFATGVGAKPQKREDVTDSTSPVAKTQSMLMGLRVARKEQRHISTADISAAFLHAKLKPAQTKEKIPFRRIIQIDAETAKIILEVKPEWNIYLNQGVGNKKTFKGFMFFELNRALYGLIESSLAWYENIIATLIEMGFTQSLSDPCVLHNYQDGNRSSIIVYVDDLLILAKNSEQTRIIIQQLKHKYTDLTHCTPDENGEIDYLNIQIRQTQEGIYLHQTKYADKLFEDLRYTPKTACERELPYQGNLFEVDHESTPLDKQEQSKYRMIIGKLLYTSTKTRIVLALPIAFLASRTVHATTQDMQKLLDILDWLYYNRNGGLLIEHHLEDDMQVYTWADASDNCHSDARGHTGIYMSIGKTHGSPVMYMSKKQNLVTKSSTESELIAVYVAIPHAQWAREALTEWGYDQQHAILYQDNISTIVISHRGNKPFSKSGHINRRYMIAQQHIEDGTLVMPHCPTDKMLPDPLTKTLNIKTSTSHYRKMIGIEPIQLQQTTLTNEEIQVFLTLFKTTDFLNDH